MTTTTDSRIYNIARFLSAREGEVRLYTRTAYAQLKAEKIFQYMRHYFGPGYYATTFPDGIIIRKRE